MLTRAQYLEYQKKAAGYLKQAGILLTPKEQSQIEVADFGLGQPEIFGLQLVVYVNTARCCAKELVLLPGQICPEHRHPPVEGEPGKEETFRCRWGQTRLYIPGEPEADISVPLEAEAYFTVRRRVVLNPGEQYTLSPDTLHWFQAGPEGAVVSEFSTTSKDEEDIFTDPRIIRETTINE